MTYTANQFETLCAEFIEREAKLMTWKAGEYAGEGDRLLNFHQIGDLMGRNPSEVALSYLLKHIQSITLAVLTGEYVWAWEKEGGEGLKQRIADARNYLLLLSGCLDEEAGTQHTCLTCGMIWRGGGKCVRCGGVLRA